MKYSASYIINAHKAATSHKEAVNESELCGCFYCRETYSPAEIEEWIDEDAGYTAQCPKCAIDAVIPSSSGYPIHDKEFLEAMYKYWFTTFTS